MKLLFDQNLSLKLCPRLADLFPGSTQARLIGLSESPDRVLWTYARQNDFILVTQDADFADLALLHGPPPKVIWLRCGNQPTGIVEKILRDHVDAIAAFVENPEAACWEVY
jgi:predicted nuclease of predicted toxin-antitoxin system